ncbi:MAG TPA: NAD-dependent epimerase/dehydratase family protein [Xanthomonadales bacterium]|nr:NAD-dependent epimerase/dehydratase family protein [Xanthomonadales bacterium]
MPSTILVAGGAGFVGSNLALRLRDRYPDARIVAADSLKRRGSEWNLPRLAAARVEFQHADIRRPDDLAFPKTRFDLIVDCSAEPAVLAAYERGPSAVIDTNLTGTVNLLEVARRDGADVVFLSTSRVYPVAALDAIAVEERPTRFALAAEQTLPGVGPAGIGESFPLDGARSLYGATKLACELLLAEYADMFGLRTIVDRCGVVTGPWQMGKADQGVFALWMGRHYFKRPLAYIGYGGTGKQVRDLIAVDELCDLVLRQIDGIATLPRRPYNVGGGLGSSLSLLEATALCEEITGNRVEIERVAENRPSDVRLYVTDNARVTAEVGWSPRRAPRETLAAIFAWIRENERLVAPLFP